MVEKQFSNRSWIMGWWVLKMGCSDGEKKKKIGDCYSPQSSY